MTKATLLPANDSIMTACKVLDDAAREFLRARTKIRGYDQYESTAEAINLFNLVVRDVEGVITLARGDLVLVPPAFACARAALETATKAAWMVNANDAYSRESRWLAHIQEEERTYERYAKRAGENSYAAQSYNQKADQLRSFRVAVQAKLPNGVMPLKRNPPVDEMLASIKFENLYTQYIYLSQFVHGGHSATSLYRRGLGTKKMLGEYIHADDWRLAFRVCWLSLIECGSLVLWRLGSPNKCFMSESARSYASRAIEGV